MKAGGELNVLVAEKVMGFTTRVSTTLMGERCFQILAGTVSSREPWEKEFAAPEDYWVDCPHYSTDIAAAWKIVEKLIPDAEFYAEKRYSEAQDKVGFAVKFDLGNRYDTFVWAETMPVAICFAALNAYGIVFESVE